ncbi:hypothetical protein SEMRO_715_G191750.1 [Seminavis robusta]|uniref:Uncharacterized protein n=1 Tax=Seminavis robusta TaxID=568900 RepID=A0A9N8EA30_9STRA|nr:hypothetical protein SEMRO_715_G191750.1 [Seminavis robusta]|eukprot:Sro715_g191750.1 n/a (258) ;mRNA; f:6246-7019
MSAGDDSDEEPSEPAPAPVVEEPADDNPQDDSTTTFIASKIKKMTTDTSTNCMEIWFPWLMYTWMAGNEHHITLDFIVLPLPESFYRPSVAEGGNQFRLSTIIPELFVGTGRVKMSNRQRDRKFNNRSAKMVAFNKSAGEVTDKLEREDPIVADNAQVVQLPFEVESQIRRWKLETFEFENDELTQLMEGAHQSVFVLTVELVGVKRIAKKHSAGAMNRFGSPTRAEDSDDDNSDASEGGDDGGGSRPEPHENMDEH